MQFAYEGFTHRGEDRCFQFRGTDGSSSVGIFCIAIDLLFFSKYRVPFQEGPRFCLQLLESASAVKPVSLDRFRSYNVVSDDFGPLLNERKRKAAVQASKAIPRKPFRKPSLASSLFLSRPAAEQ